MQNIVPRVSPLPSRWGLLVMYSDIGTQTLKRQDDTFPFGTWSIVSAPWVWEGRWVEGIHEWAYKHTVTIAPPTSLPSWHLPVHNSILSGCLPSMHPVPLQELPLEYLGCNPHSLPGSLAPLHLHVPGSLPTELSHHFFASNSTSLDILVGGDHLFFLAPS